MRFCSRSVAVAIVPVVASLVGVCAMALEGALPDASELFDRQEYDEARRVLENLPETTRETGQALYYLGRLDLIDGDRKRAEKRLEEAIEADPEQSEYHYWLAAAIMRGMPYRNFLGRMTGGMKMLKEFRRAIDLDPANLKPRITLYQMMVRSYDRGSASREELLEQVESVAGIDSIMGLVALGTFYQLVDKDMDKAGAALRRAHELAPTNRAAAISYADYKWDLDDRDEAIRVLAAFVESEPADKLARFNLGMRTILRGTDYEGARRLFEECLSLKSNNGLPTEAMVRWCLGLACHLLGDVDRSQAEWSAVSELDPDFAGVLEVNPELSELNSMLGETK